MSPVPTAISSLPPGVTVLERVWLSSNNIVHKGRERHAVVDTGYVSHAPQTLQLVTAALGAAPLTDVVCTHLHSDHCGGNHLLQTQFQSARTWVPQSQLEDVAKWDLHALSFEETGQRCDRFIATHGLVAGQSILLGDLEWEVKHAPGHDPDSVMLFQPEFKCLISADALWENGFGVVFPELDGVDAFDEVGESLDLIEALNPSTVIPGHGRVFMEVATALERARSRLSAFQADSGRHAKHAAKVLMKFKLMEWQSVSAAKFYHWADQARLIRTTAERFFPTMPPQQFVGLLLGELQSAGALQIKDGQVQDLPV
jgi:glyoxylase-like metal-dependent hydrolase (beta-lactamase superfamily II)